MPNREVVATMGTLDEQVTCELLEARFVDILGRVKAMAIPLDKPTSDLAQVAADPAVARGVSADGSSVAGYAQIEDSDLHLAPDASTVFRLPYDPRRAAAYCNVTQRGDGAPVAADSRNRLKAVLAENLGAGQRIEIKPELEFFLLQGDAPADAGAYLDVSPENGLSAHLDEYHRVLTAMGVLVERVHHECAPGQVEVEIDYAPIITQADRLISSKLAIRTLAERAGLRATFMPKPIAGLAGSGMHVHTRLFEGSANAFRVDDGKLSTVGQQFVAGLLEHASALTAICNPSVNSYKRLVPNHEAPVLITWGYRNRSSLVRIPLAKTPEKGAVEFRSPDATCNFYLALAALVAAGMDGVRRGLTPPDDRPENVYQLTPAQLKRLHVRSLPGHLGEALDALERDDVVLGALGPALAPKFLELHRARWDEYLHGTVTDWERATYCDC
jgi:glutamine synthetase